MIREHFRKTIIDLHNNGTKKKVIARTLNIDIKTIRRICQEEAEVSRRNRIDKKTVEPELLIRIYNYCNGYVKRMHEILTEEYKIDIGYSTLTRLVNEQGIGRKKKKRADQYPDVPGEEMQHDTSTYHIIINNKKTKVVCASIYLRYSKLLYIKFYLRFNRFKMKCFIHEALIFWQYSGKICIIDNTNLAVKSGTGAKAIFQLEMVMFAKNYGFEWKAHAIGHSNRKAGEERGFYTIETNFIPGRTFANMDDLNAQAFQWATVRKANRPMSKTGLIPLKLFETEKTYLNKLAPEIHPPYQVHKRSIDQYGYIVFDVNYYWVPEKVNGKKISSKNVDVIEYQEKIVIYDKQQMLITHNKVPEGIQNQKIDPEGVNKRFYEPKSIKKGSEAEEMQLRKLGKKCNDYLDFIYSKECDIRQKHKFIRDLYSFSKKVHIELFDQSVQRALEFKIDNIKAFERISLQVLKNDSDTNIEITGSNEYKKRISYQKGRFSRENNLDHFQKILENNKNF